MATPLSVHWRRNSRVRKNGSASDDELSSTTMSPRRLNVPSRSKRQCCVGSLPRGNECEVRYPWPDYHLENCRKYNVKPAKQQPSYLPGGRLVSRCGDYSSVPCRCHQLNGRSVPHQPVKPAMVGAVYDHLLPSGPVIHLPGTIGIETYRDLPVMIDDRDPSRFALSHAVPPRRVVTSSCFPPYCPQQPSAVDCSGPATARDRRNSLAGLLVPQPPIEMRKSSGAIRQSRPRTGYQSTSNKTAGQTDYKPVPFHSRPPSRQVEYNLQERVQQDCKGAIANETHLINSILRTSARELPEEILLRSIGFQYFSLIRRQWRATVPTAIVISKLEQLCHRAVRMLRSCEYPPEDILCLFGVAASRVPMIVARLKASSLEEVVHVALVQVFLAHSWLFDEACPIKEWHQHVFSTYCSFTALNSALIHLFQMQHYRLNVDPKDVFERILTLLPASYLTQLRSSGKIAGDENWAYSNGCGVSRLPGTGTVTTSDTPSTRATVVSSSKVVAPPPTIVGAGIKGIHH